MARSNESNNTTLPALPDQQGWRHWGDGLAGKLHGARLQGFYPTAADYRDVQVDVNGVLQTSGGAGGGGAATIADGADVAEGSTADVAYVSGSGTVVAILKGIFGKLAGTLTVATHAVTQSGAWTTGRTWALLNTTDSVNVGNFPATQPVSLAAAVDVSDRAARLLGVVDKGKVWDGTNIAAVKAGVVAVVADNPLVVTVHPSSAATAAQPVTGTFFQATQPVSAAALPLPAGAATAANQPTLKAASAVAAATDTASVVQHAPQRADAANLCVTATAATGVAATLTIPSAGAGLFHYISLIEIQLYATAARTGSATPVLVTTTNLPGSPVWDFDTAQAIGVTIRQSTQPATPIKSSAAATATTIVAPIATTGIWRITAYYYAAP